ncbi:MAG: GreA/GreB family elongation factor [Verrucomicrobiae bacterium]|nr:GreA/GreB family elongation factor [Verrucomicrobiae bacterium]
MKLPLFVSNHDERRLRWLIEARRHSTRAPADRDQLNRLAAELDRAHILPEHEMPPDAVRLGSRVEAEDLEDGEIFTVTPVLPQEADVSHGRISILAPLGVGLLGYRVGNEFEWPVPGGILRLRILRILNVADGRA